MLPSSQAQHLTPKLLLSRSSLPLAYLNNTGSQEGEHGPSLFSAWIEVLEAEPQEVWPFPPIVLITESTKDGRLYAVERVQRGIYALCMLGSWASQRTLERSTAQRRHTLSSTEGQKIQQSNQLEHEWWRAATVPLVHSAKPNGSSSFGVGKSREIKLCLQRPVQTSLMKSVTNNVERAASEEIIQAETALVSMVQEVSRTPEEALDIIRSQYLEALYASKVILVHRSLLHAVADLISRHPWLILQKDRFPGLEPCFVHRMDLRLTKQSLCNT